VDGLGSPVLPESIDESLDHSMEDPPVRPSHLRVINVDPLPPPKSTMAVGAVASSSGRRVGGKGDSPSSTSDRPLRLELMFDLEDVLR
jgi:hypothetical protein